MTISPPPSLFSSIRKRLLISHSYNAAMDHSAIDDQKTNLSAPSNPDQRKLPRSRAAALAREVRNPLTCIDLSIDMLNSAVTDPELKAYMEMITKSSKRIDQLIKELLECQEIATPSQTQY
jgi:nitrogen-specific signal transduction histidine kinase